MKYYSRIHIRFIPFLIIIGFTLLACRTFAIPIEALLSPSATAGAKEGIPKKATRTAAELDENGSGVENANKIPRGTIVRNLNKTPGAEDELNAIIRGFFTPTVEFITETTPEITSTITPTEYQAAISQAAVTPDITSKPVELPDWIKSELRASDPTRVKLNSGKYQFFEFFAFWCGACQALAPEIQNLEEKYGGDIIFTYLDIDDPANEYFKKELRFQKEPHFILVDGEGKRQKEWVGFVSYQELVEIFEAISPTAR